MRITEATNDAAILRELGERIERVRRDRGWTRATLAERSGVSERTLARLEDGASLQLATWLAVLRALDLLDALDTIGAPAGPSPLALLDESGGRRRRKQASAAPAAGMTPGSRKGAEAPASAETTAPASRGAWRWGDES